MRDAESTPCWSVLLDAPEASHLGVLPLETLLPEDAGAPPRGGDLYIDGSAMDLTQVHLQAILGGRGREEIM